MKFFDLHCDTLTACLDSGGKHKNKGLQLSLDRGSCFDVWHQCLAVWFRENADLQSQKKRFCECAEMFEKLKAGNLSAHLTLENAVIAMLPELCPGVLRDVYGVVMLSLTWNGQGPLADGCLAPSGGGLTKRGKEIALEADCNGIVLDASHLSRRGFYELAQLVDSPIAASHSNACSVCEHKRNLTDEQIRIIAERGGVIGLCFYPEFLGEGDVFERLYQHADRIMTAGGESCLCIGSDFDGADMADRLKSVADVPSLYDYFVERGFGKELTDRIFYNNAQFFLDKVLQ